MGALLRLRLNWTKVGLKVAGIAMEDRDAAGLNWTKVGLKGYLHEVTQRDRALFELD